MQCLCGGSTKSSTSQVKTLKKAQEWSSKVDKVHLPISIDSDTCDGCGRARFTIKSNSGEWLEQRG